MQNDDIITEFSGKNTRCGKLVKLIFSAIQQTKKDEGWTACEIAHCLKKYHKLSLNEGALTYAVKVCLNKKNCLKFLRRNDRNGKYYYISPRGKTISCKNPADPVISSALSVLDNNPFARNNVKIMKPILKLPFSRQMPSDVVISSNSIRNCSKQTQIFKKFKPRPKTNPRNEAPTANEIPKYNVKQTQTESEKLNKSTSPRFCSVGTMKRSSGRLTSSLGSLASLNSKHEECQCDYDFEGFNKPKPCSSRQSSELIGTVKKHPVKSSIASYGESKKRSSAKTKRNLKKNKNQKTNYVKPKTKSQEIQDLVDTYCQNEKQRRARRIKKTKLGGDKKKQNRKKTKKTSTKTPVVKSKSKKKKQKMKVIKVLKVTK